MFRGAFKYAQGFRLISSFRIIGAGLSGLRCADILTQNGAQVTILEARDRIGGRVLQGEVGGHVVDIGPNWIHGAGENPIMTIAEATQTTFNDPEGKVLIVSRDGHPLDADTAVKISNFVWKTIDDAFSYSRENSDRIPSERSLFDFFADKVQETDFTPEEKQYVLDSSKLWGAYVGDSVERQSLRFFHLEECVDGSNYIVSSTYKRILEYVAKPALAHASIKLEQPVVNINAPIRDIINASNHKVTVTTATGDHYAFDEVVVTCPLGWLKRNTSAFTPELPTRLLSAIDSISYGRLEKIYVTFPRAFWQLASKQPNVAQNEDLVFAQFLDPAYDNHPSHIEWKQECLSFASLPEPYSHPTLLFYTYGACGAEIVARIASLDPTSAEYRDALIQFVEPYYSRLPGYSPASPDCVPRELLGTRWGADQYAGYGSYSNFQVGLKEGDRDIETLRSGAGVHAERGLWFAGEHTAPFVALGTTTGAYWSGERVAAQICESRGLEKADLDGLSRWMKV
ncbi:Amine oxidase [Penicillium taxi]|uniref:Amine oxidase n=1 Tax=Penicillium taxi TaxID=168475 RepID=UPI0025459207|nr:Amine oxidase [Penicillium taxi]KAJ5887884.1 Amine oxidase [Penicillium taxi]